MLPMIQSQVYNNKSDDNSVIKVEEKSEVSDNKDEGGGGICC
jgi:hypothetical protein